MEHIFYIFNQYLSLLIRRIISVFHTLQVTMKKPNIILFNNITKFNLTSFSLHFPETLFYPNLISKIRAQKDRIYPDSVPKTHNSSSLISKRLCSISPLPTGPFHYFEQKNTKKMIRISFHFENPRSTCPRSTRTRSPATGFWWLGCGGVGTQIPVLPHPRIPVLPSRLIAVYCLLISGFWSPVLPFRLVAVYCSLFAVRCSPFFLPPVFGGLPPPECLTGPSPTAYD
jgi:hypothetical protein